MEGRRGMSPAGFCKGYKRLLYRMCPSHSEMTVSRSPERRGTNMATQPLPSWVTALGKAEGLGLTTLFWAQRAGGL